MTIRYRDHTRASDIGTVRSIVESTGFFTPDEVGVAVELVEENRSKGTASGYYFLFAQDDSGDVLGYTCYGPIPCTQQSYDLYWIAVRRDQQGHGLGRHLIEATELAIADLGGTRVYIETSSRPLYEPTRQFYLRSGYQVEASLKDFYSPGDDKLIFSRELPRR